MNRSDDIFRPEVFVPRKQEPDFRSEFWQEMPDMRNTTPRNIPATTNICRYLDGKHEMPPQRWCTHFSHEDETGKRIREDWTVQVDSWYDLQ